MGFGIARGGHLGKWRPYWNFAWPAFFPWRVTPIMYLCQICCLYHNLNDSSDICNYLLHYTDYNGVQPFPFPMLNAMPQIPIKADFNFKMLYPCVTMIPLMSREQNLRVHMFQICNIRKDFNMLYSSIKWYTISSLHYRLIPEQDWGNIRFVTKMIICLLLKLKSKIAIRKQWNFV